MPHRENTERELCGLLRELTRALQDVTGEGPYGLLGGDDGYGVEFSNDVFEMHPFYWDDCECGFDERVEEWAARHPHSDRCYQTELDASGAHDMDWDDPRRDDILADLCARHCVSPGVGRMTHCTCGRDWDYVEWSRENRHDPSCGIVRPNFRHHGTGFEARWYKYIGRGMEFENRQAGRRAIQDAITLFSTGSA